MGKGKIISGKRMTKADVIVEIFLQAIGLCICVVVLFPILNMVAESFSSTGPVKRGEVLIWPIQFTLDAYEMVLTNPKIMRALFNTIYLVIVDCLAKTAMVYLCAYPLALCEFPGKKVWSLIIMVAMWVSAGTIPTFLHRKSLGLYDSYWALILGGLISSYNVMITRNFLQGIPKELVDSARIDGAKEIRILWNILLPLSKPILATLAIWNISATWNSYMEPTIYLASQDKFVLQQILRSIMIEMDMSSLDMSFIGSDSNDLSIQVKAAVFVISMVPMVVMYPFAQKHFVKGVSVGAVKG